MKKVLVWLFAFFLLQCNLNMVIAATSPNVASPYDDYSGRDDLKTVALGRSAFTEDGRGGVVVNVFKKIDGGAYVVLITLDGSGRRPTNAQYITAYVNNNHQICFTWQGRKYHTPSDEYRFK